MLALHLLLVVVLQRQIELNLFNCGVRRYVIFDLLISLVFLLVIRVNLILHPILLHLVHLLLLVLNLPRDLVLVIVLLR